MKAGKFCHVTLGCLGGGDAQKVKKKKKKNVSFDVWVFVPSTAFPHFALISEKCRNKAPFIGLSTNALGLWPKSAVCTQQDPPAHLFLKMKSEDAKCGEGTCFSFTTQVEQWCIVTAFPSARHFFFRPTSQSDDASTFSVAPLLSLHSQLWAICKKYKLELLESTCHTFNCNVSDLLALREAKRERHFTFLDKWWTERSVQAVSRKLSVDRFFSCSAIAWKPSSVIRWHPSNFKSVIEGLLHRCLMSLFEVFELKLRSTRSSFVSRESFVVNASNTLSRFEEWGLHDQRPEFWRQVVCGHIYEVCLFQFQRLNVRATLRQVSQHGFRNRLFLPTRANWNEKEQLNGVTQSPGQFYCHQTAPSPQKNTPQSNHSVAWLWHFVCSWGIEPGLTCPRIPSVKNLGEMGSDQLPRFPHIHWAWKQTPNSEHTCPPCRHLERSGIPVHKCRSAHFFLLLCCPCFPSVSSFRHVHCKDQCNFKGEIWRCKMTLRQQNKKVLCLFWTHQFQSKAEELFADMSNFIMFGFQDHMTTKPNRSWFWTQKEKAFWVDSSGLWVSAREGKKFPLTENEFASHWSKAFTWLVVSRDQNIVKLQKSHEYSFLSHPNISTKYTK